MQNFLVKLVSVMMLIIFPIAFVWTYTSWIYNRSYVSIESVGDVFRVTFADWKSIFWDCKTFYELMKY